MPIASIYYTARRPAALNDRERASIDALIDEYSVDDQITERERALDEDRPNWESFCVYDANDRTEPDVVFEGATGLPDNSAEGMWLGLQHWCQLLTRIRRVIPDADWSVRVDDHEIRWDEEAEAYDPSA